MKRGLLLGGLIAYLLFHLIRADLPPGIFRHSLPSFLLIPVALPLVDWIGGWLDARRAHWSERGSVILLATTFAAAYFEAFAPFILGRGDADPFDALATGLGGLFYYGAIRWSRSRHRRN